MSLPAEGDGENNSATPDSTQMNQMPNQKIPLIETVQPTELQRLLQAQNPEVVVIDVRGRDHEGGHIPNSIWIKTNGVIANPGFLMAEIRARKVTSVVFTCMYSVLRARRCCSALAQYQQKERLESKHAGYLIKIQILAGGFHGWLNHFLNQGDHGEKQIEDYTKSCWTKATDDIGNLGYVHVMDALWSEAGQKKLIKNLEEELEKCALEKLARGGGGRDEDEQVGGDVSGQRPDVEDEEDVGVRPHPPSSPAGEIVEMDGLGRAGGVDADVLGRAATEGGVEMGFMAGIVGNAQDVEVEQQQGTGRQESRYGEDYEKLSRDVGEYQAESSPSRKQQKRQRLLTTLRHLEKQLFQHSEQPASYHLQRSEIQRRAELLDIENPPSPPMRAQQQLFKDQDQNLDLLAGTVTTLKHIGYEIKDEVQHQDGMLDHLGNEMEDSQSKIKSTAQMLRELDKDGSLCFWWGAIIILFVLNVLVAVFL
eukprot:g2177.t1